MGKLNYAAILPLALLATACSSDAVDIGDDKTGEYLADYAGSWDGYAEAHEFDSGSSRVRIVLDALGQGTIEFGDAPPLPAPTDPEVGYPPGGEYVWEGFQFPAHEIKVEARRLRFGLNLRDLSGEWCEMQTPMLIPERSTPEHPYYRCAPLLDAFELFSDDGCFRLDAGTRVYFDCGKLLLCQDGCRCTADSCELYVFPTLADYPLRFDIALQNGAHELVGTMLTAMNGTEQRITIRLTRR